MKTVWLVLALAVSLYEAAAVKPPPKNQKGIKYVVFPGVEVDNAVAAGWTNGYASPWNVIFGKKPYVIGWVGDDYQVEEPPFEYEEEDYQQEEVIDVAADAPHDQVTEDRGKKKNEKSSHRPNNFKVSKQQV